LLVTLIESVHFPLQGISIAIAAVFWIATPQGRLATTAGHGARQRMDKSFCFFFQKEVLAFLLHLYAA